MTSAGTTWMKGSGVSNSSKVSNNTATPTKRFVAPTGICQRGRIALSRCFKVGTIRRTTTTRWRAGEGLVGDLAGKCRARRVRQ